MTESTETSKHQRFLLASVVLLVLTVLTNMWTISFPFAGVGFYSLAFILTVVICVLTLFRKHRYLNALILIDLLLLAAGTVYGWIASPPGPYL